MIYSMASLALIHGGDLYGYVGPGPALSMTWALLGLMATLGAALFALMAWPVRRLLRRRRQNRAS